MCRLPTFFIGVSFILLQSAGLWAQKIEALPNSNLRFYASAEAKDPYLADGCDPSQSQADSAQGVSRIGVSGINGVSNRAFAAVKAAPSSAFTTCDARARSGVSLVLREMRDSLLRLNFDLETVSEMDCGDPSGQRCDWLARGKAELEGYIDLLVTGYNPGQPYVFYYYGKVTSQTAGNSESNNYEDTCAVLTDRRYLNFGNGRVVNNLDSNAGIPVFARYELNGIPYRVEIPDLENAGFRGDNLTRAAKIAEPIGHFRTFSGSADTVRFFFNVHLEAAIHDPAQSTGSFFQELADRGSSSFAVELDMGLITLQSNSPVVSNPDPLLNNDNAYGFPSDQGGYPELPQDSIFPIPYIQLGNGCQNETVFSLDIASDREYSDPNLDGDEDMDAGDLYNTSGTNGVTALHFDDANLNAGTDPAPNSIQIPVVCDSSLTTAGNDVSQAALNFFDIDGIDYLDFELVNHDFGPFGDGVIEFNSRAESPCIRKPDWILLSYDDDPIYSWPGNVGSSGSFLLCDHPVNPGYPLGLAGEQDEVFSGFSSRVPTGFGDGLHVLSLLPSYSESGFAPSLRPDPRPQGPQFAPAPRNDDVDALDFLASSNCNVLYFTVDHEGKGLSPNQSLDPGTVYQYEAGTGQITAIVQPGDYGMPPGTDLSAFEFAWISTDNWPNGAFAMVFSVDADDEWTFSVNESGGNQYSFNVLYYSLLQGDIGVFADSILFVPAQDSTFPYNHNIDALTFTCSPPSGLAVVETYDVRIDLGGMSRAEIEISDWAGVTATPNPVEQALHLQADEPGPYRLRLYDLQGKLLWQGSMEEELVIDARVLKRGVNILEIQSTNSEKSARIKVIKPD